MVEQTPEEIEAGRAFTPEERAAEKARRAAIWAGEAVKGIVEVDDPTAGIPQDTLETRAMGLGVPVSDLTPDQIEEVRASLPAPRARGGRRKTE